MSSFDASELLASYKQGLGYKPGDILTPRPRAIPHAFGVIENKVVVLEQSTLAPHKYTVIGEKKDPRTPAARFVKFEIDGHEWQKVGRAHD